MVQYLFLTGLFYFLLSLFILLYDAICLQQHTIVLVVRELAL